MADQREAALTPEQHDLVRVAIAALVLRLIGAFASQHTLPVVASDTAYYYLPIARSLYAGQGFSVGGSHTDAAMTTPLYPMWLAAHMLWVGPHIPLWLIAITNAALRTLGCVALFVLTRRAFGRSAALIAAAIYIVDPWEAFWTGYMLKESLAIPLLLLAVWLLDRAARAGTSASYAAAGAMTGVTTLVRVANGSMAIALVVVAVLAFRGREEGHGRRVLMRAAAGLTAFLLVVSPWMIRNWLVVGQPVLTTQFVGQKLYTSNGPGVQAVSDGYYAPKGIDENLTARYPVERSMQQESHLVGVTTRHMLLHPLEQVSRLGMKMVNMWRPTFADSSLRNLVILGGSYLLFIAVSLVGIVTAARRRDSCLAIAVTLAVFFAVHLLFRGEIRNRQYLMPMFYAFGGLAISTLNDRHGLFRKRAT